jgi:hypothetical protein
MSDFGLLIGVGLGAGAGAVVAGGYLGYKILKKKNPQLLEKIVVDIKHGFSEGFTRAYSTQAGKEITEKATRPKSSRFKGLTKAFCEGFDNSYCSQRGQDPTVALA